MKDIYYLIHSQIILSKLFNKLEQYVKLKLILNEHKRGQHCYFSTYNYGHTVKINGNEVIFSYTLFDNDNNFIISGNINSHDPDTWKIPYLIMCDIKNNICDVIDNQKLKIKTVMERYAYSEVTNKEYIQMLNN